MAEPDTDTRYPQVLALFDDAVVDASRVSRAAADRQVDARPWWGKCFVHAHLHDEHELIVPCTAQPVRGEVNRTL